MANKVLIFCILSVISFSCIGPGRIAATTDFYYNYKNDTTLLSAAKIQVKLDNDTLLQTISKKTKRVFIPALIYFYHKNEILTSIATRHSEKSLSDNFKSIANSLELEKDIDSIRIKIQHYNPDFVYHSEEHDFIFKYIVKKKTLKYIESKGKLNTIHYVVYTKTGKKEEEFSLEQKAVICNYEKQDKITLMYDYFEMRDASEKEFIIQILKLIVENLE